MCKSDVNVYLWNYPLRIIVAALLPLPNDKADRRIGTT